MAVERRSSMGAIQKHVSQALGWPAAQLQWLREQVAERIDASNQAARERYARARAENAAKVVEVSPASSGDGVQAKG
jgi:hypothetical protein